ncbi:hypothetical protein [Arthrobacter sp. D2-10]
MARLAFIAMWNWADDHGRGTANLKELEGFIFPNDDLAELSSGNTVHFREVVAEVSECFNVTFYTVSGRPFYQIPSWDSHQRNERRAAQSKYPGPDQADSTGSPLTTGNAGVSANADSESRKLRDAVAEIPHTSDAGTGEQGNRGTGEQNTSSPATPSRVRVPSGAFEVFWQEYPRKVGKAAAEKVFKREALKHGADSIIEGARRLAQDPNLPEAQFIPHASTWLGRGGWEDEPLPSRKPTGKPSTRERLEGIQALKRSPSPLNIQRELQSYGEMP